MAEDTDYLYKNAPLIEVYAEFRWEIVKISSLPGAAIDPHYSTYKEEFEKNSREAGFQFVEDLLVPSVPIELIPYRPTHRFRRASGEWPLYQIGPGFFAVNAVPPYGGWKSFRQEIKSGLGLLMRSYPLPDKYLKLQQIELRYIDGFSKQHGFESFYKFANENLNVGAQFPTPLLEGDRIKRESTQFQFEARFDLVRPENSTGFIKLSPGQVVDQAATIVELFVRSDLPQFPIKEESIIEWFDQSHEYTREWFEGIVTEKLRDKIGPKEPLQEMN